MHQDPPQILSRFLVLAIQTLLPLFLAPTLEAGELLGPREAGQQPPTLEYTEPPWTYYGAFNPNPEYSQMKEGTHLF